MACFFVDLDGTLLKWGTNEWLPGAKAFLVRLMEQGHEVILTTGRSDEHAAKGVCPSEFETEQFFQKEGFSFGILFDVDPERHIVNDHYSSVIYHERDTPWD